MAAKKESEDGNYKVADEIIVKLDERRKVHATVRAVYQEDGKTKLNIDFGHEETATIGLADRRVWALEEPVRPAPYTPSGSADAYRNGESRG
jgi:hypothetical protein